MPVSGMQAIAGAEGDNESFRIFLAVDWRSDGNQEAEMLSWGRERERKGKMSMTDRIYLAQPSVSSLTINNQNSLLFQSVQI